MSLSVFIREYRRENERMKITLVLQILQVERTYKHTEFTNHKFI